MALYLLRHCRIFLQKANLRLYPKRGTLKLVSQCTVNRNIVYISRDDAVVAICAHNAKAVGSIPTLATRMEAHKMKWFLIILGIIIFFPVIKRILGFALKILSWLLWPVIILLIGGAIFSFIKGMIVAGILLIVVSGILGSLIFIPDWFDYYD